MTLVRAALFIIVSAIILAAAGPLTRTLPASWSPAVAGLVTSAFTFALTVLFTRWNGITLSDVGARATSGTGPRLALVVAACFTSFYSWRLIFMTFHGKPKGGDHPAHRF